MRKKVLSITIIFTLAFSLCSVIPMNVMAQTNSYVSGIYTYTVEDEQATVRGVDGTISGDVVIPAELGGYPVVAIGSNCFKDCKSITSVDIPDSVTEIGINAFLGCENIQIVTMGDNVQTIYRHAFSDCSSLTTIELSDTLTTIGSRAFSDCVGLIEMVIPDSVTEIGEAAFINCSNLSSVTMSNNILSIGNWAYGFCSSLEKITIPDSATQLDSSVFAYCSSLSEASLGLGITEISDGCFFACSALETIQVNGALTKICGGAFAGCASLREFTFNSSLQYIGNNAFQGCVSLTNVELPDSVTEIGNNAFSGCENIQTLTMGDNVETIGASAFRGCSLITAFDCPEALISIGELAFAEWSSLESFELGSNVTEIGESAFQECLALTSFKMNHKLETISNNAFNGCIKLNSVVLPDSLDSIGEGAFFNCCNMTTLDLGEGVSKIGPCAFQNCVLLNEVELPESITIIAENTFMGCISLHTVYLHDTLEEISSQAFQGCFNMKDVYYEGTETEWASVVVENNNNPIAKATIHYNVKWLDDESVGLNESIRLSGQTRFETSFAIANKLKEQWGVEKFDTVIIASGMNFPDALAGSYLANVKEAPILLVYDNADNIQAVKEYINANVSEDGIVYLLGGTNAVPAAMETGLDAFTVKRLAGANRFETNLMILEEAGVKAGEDILVATGTNFADSLSASATGKPILLVYNESGQLMESQKAFLAKHQQSNLVILGGTSAVSETMKAQLTTYDADKKVERLAGTDRFETSVLVAETYFKDPDVVVLANALTFPDGLCGGPLAYRVNAPLILTAKGNETLAKTYVESKDILVGIVLGGTEALPDAVVKAILKEYSY